LLFQIWNQFTNNIFTMNTLNLKRTHAREIIAKWQISLPQSCYTQLLFVRCNAKGIVNWESGKTAIYTADEIKDRKTKFH